MYLMKKKINSELIIHPVFIFVYYLYHYCWNQFSRIIYVYMFHFIIYIFFDFFSSFIYALLSLENNKKDELLTIIYLHVNI